MAFITTINFVLKLPTVIMLRSTQKFTMNEGFENLKTAQKILKNLKLAITYKIKISLK